MKLEKVNSFKVPGLFILVVMINCMLYLWAMFPWNPAYGQWAFGLSLYLGVVGIAVLLFGHGLAKGQGSYQGGCYRALHWVALWHGMTGTVVLVGGLIGMLLFLGLGSLFGLGEGAQDLMVKGLKDGAFYAFIWAPGLSMVACFINAYGREKERGQA